MFQALAAMAAGWSAACAADSARSATTQASSAGAMYAVACPASR
ncbi:hypothetical protein SMICM17S_12942 [Streptomyces microflavus]